jgi:hypothetical protein
MPTNKEANDITALTFTSALAIALIKKGLLSRQEIKNVLSDLTTPLGLIGATMYNDIVQALDRWKEN